MIAANFTEFRTNLTAFLNAVEDNNETLIVKRGAGKGAVMISLQEYNAILETMHLLKSKKNADWLHESIQQMRAGDIISKDLLED